VKHWVLCFLFSLLLVGPILFATERIPALQFLLQPGLLVSLLISRSSDTSDFSFVAGMIVNTLCYTLLLSLFAKLLKQQSKSR